ncbi:thiamine diphosphate-binding protein, partial [Thozetella sp. PMI_491]
TMPSQTVADLFLEALANAGIDYLFAVLGSDHPSIIEAYVRRQEEQKAWPKLLVFLHEATLSAADGFARLTKRPQCVIVHVDVGTAALGQGLHNASSGRSPVLIFAGQAPLTLNGELPGSRSEHVQWYQDIPNQAGLIAPYSRYSNKIKCAEHVELLVRRALTMSTAGSPGPSYLTATREVLAARTDISLMTSPSRKLTSFVHPPVVALPTAAVSAIASALMDSTRPLVVTGYLGRSNGAVSRLVELADLLPNLYVFDSESREMSFPATHPACLTRTGGVISAAVKAADVILVLDADVPWIPTKLAPSVGAKVYHIDIDPYKERMTSFDIGSVGTWGADCEIALEQICSSLRSFAEVTVWDESERGTEARKTRIVRWEGIQKMLDAKAEPREDGMLSVDHLFRTLREVLPQDTIWVSDAVTNQVALSEQLRLEATGTNSSKGGSGLGWAGGAAIGIKLATDLYDTDQERPSVIRRAGNSSRVPKFICSITGDGSFIFGAPSAVFWAQYQHKTPFLTVIVNNGGWKATRACINDVHPGGFAAKVSDHELGIDLRGHGPDYLGIVEAAAGGNLVTARVAVANGLRERIAELADEVQTRKIGAVLEAIVV